MDIKGVYWNKQQKAFFVLRHINVKIKVEALLGIGEIFPPEYYNLETSIRTQIYAGLPDYKTDFYSDKSERIKTKKTAYNL